MKIIKHGKAMTDMQFVCKACGCEFIASNGEYSMSIAGHPAKRIALVFCPECDHTVSKEVEA